MTDALRELPKAFRLKADDLEPYAPPAAVAWREAAEVLEEALEAALDDLLPIAEAADEFGWTYEGLRRRVRADEELNSGAPNAPAVRRRDMLALGRGRGPRTPKNASDGAAHPSDKCADIIENIIHGDDE